MDYTYIQFEVPMSVFICSVMAVADCSYVLKCKDLIPINGSLPSLYSPGIGLQSANRCVS
jgi:hypothetical protein